MPLESLTNTDTNESVDVPAEAPTPLFHTGAFHATPGALAFLSERLLTVVPLYDRHVSGDWSEMSLEDQAANAAAIKSGGRVLSRYTVEHQPIWVITEADRSSTTILLPEEY